MAISKINIPVVILSLIINLVHCRSSSSTIGSLDSPPSIPPPPPTVFQIQQCRDGCLDKHAADEFACLQGTDCLMCWNQCTTTQDPISSDAANVVYDEWPLNVVSMVREGYLVTTVITWPKQTTPNKCLVTWEVMGGGLMGSLFTETSDVELSLWPETAYNIQVTCKSKETKQMSRSLLLTLDTKYAKEDSTSTTTTSRTTTTTSPAMVPAKATLKVDFDHHFNDDVENSIEDQVTSSSLLGVKITLINSRRLEAVLGLVTAISIFITLTVILFKRRRRVGGFGRRQPVVDKQCLLAHEVLNPDRQIHVSFSN